MDAVKSQADTARGIKLTVVGLLILIAIIVGGFVNRVSMPRVMTDAELKLNGAYMFETPRALPQFSLTQHTGQVFENRDLQGRWTLVFFGFTHCPDICPTTMALLAQLMQKLDGLPESEDTQVIMVTVDPARDTPEKLAEYVPYFNPNFVGVTGDFMALHKVATALNTPFRKVPGQGADYQVDHGSSLVLLNPRGDYHGFFKAPLDLAKLKVTYRSVRTVWDLQQE
jgi:protein SCO1/2